MEDCEAVAPLHRVVIHNRVRPQQQVGADEDDAQPIGARGRGAFLNGKRLKASRRTLPSPSSAPSAATAATSAPLLMLDTRVASGALLGGCAEATERDLLASLSDYGPAPVPARAGERREDRGGGAEARARGRGRRRR